MSQFHSRAGLARGVVALTLLVQVAPALFALVAGVGHSAFHGLERTVRARLTESLVEAISELPTSGFSHSHGAGSDPHSHAAPVDLALTVVGDVEEETPAREATPERKVDPHAPPARIVLLPAPAVSAPLHSGREGADSAERATPPLPPPRG